MSETTAFLAGTAAAGVTALLVLKGGLGIGPTQMPFYGNAPIATTPVAPIVQAPAAAPIAATTDPVLQNQANQLQQQIAQQQNASEFLKQQLEQQKRLTDDLQRQLEQQRGVSDRAIAQLQEQQRSVDRMAVQNPSGAIPPGYVQSQNSNNNNSQSTLLWLIGGMAAIMLVGGGGILIVILLLASQQTQQRRRPSRNPYAGPPMPLPPVYPADLYAPYPPPRPHPTFSLPPRMRRVEQNYYDD